MIYLLRQSRERTPDPRERVSDYDGTYGNASNDKYSLRRATILQCPQDIYNCNMKIAKRERNLKLREIFLDVRECKEIYD